MQMTGRVLFGACAEPLPQFFRALRNVGKTFKQRAQIQSRAHGEYRQALALTQVPQSAQSELAVAPRGCIILWSKHVDQMMWNAAPFGIGGLCGADVKAAIQLRRIACHNFPAKAFRELHSERRLPRCRRTDNGNER